MRHLFFLFLVFLLSSGVSTFGQQLEGASSDICCVDFCDDQLSFSHFFKSDVIKESAVCVLLMQLHADVMSYDGNSPRRRCQSSVQRIKQGAAKSQSPSSMHIGGAVYDEKLAQVTYSVVKDRNSLFLSEQSGNLVFVLRKIII